jgi:GDPmannose 4,6-dehydratase
MRRSSSFSTGRIEHVRERLHLHFGDMTDSMSLLRILEKVRPHEVYNLAAQSHVRVSFDLPVYTGDSVALGTARLLEAIRDFQDRNDESIRFYQASSSEIYGRVAETPQTEDTRFRPRSPYACAKVYGHMLTVNYRESYGLHASCGILFNHESPRRGETFVTRKITRAAGRIQHGLQETVALGNLDAQRDWGFAGDYVEAMWLMLQQAEPDDYVIATGQTRSVREFGTAVFNRLGMEFSDRAIYDPRYLRPAEVDLLLGDATKARTQLGWQPKTSFEDLVATMVDYDLELARREVLCLT